MNIFVLDEDLEKCARYHVDKHVIKMILESAQLLSSAVRVSGIDAGYKLTHKNHPCAIWARESLDNWLWLKDLSTELHKEWKFRYNHPSSKMHKSYEVILDLPNPEIPSIGMTRFKMAMPKELQSDNIVTSYRNYYIQEKAHLASWKNRDKPYWWE